MLLLETSWRDIFLISLAQSDVTVDWSQALVDSAAGRPWITSYDVTTLSSHTSQVVDVVQRLRHMKLDVTEYTCLKALVLFRPGQRQDCSTTCVGHISVRQFVTALSAGLA